MNKVNRKELEYFVKQVMGYQLVKWQIDCIEKYINILKSNDKKSIIIPRGSGYSSTYAWLYIISQLFLLYEEENKNGKS